MFYNIALKAAAIGFMFYNIAVKAAAIGFMLYNILSKAAAVGFMLYNIAVKAAAFDTMLYNSGLKFMHSTPFLALKAAFFAAPILFHRAVIPPSMTNSEPVT